MHYSYETTSVIQARIKTLMNKQARHERLSQSEQRQLIADSQVITDRIIERDGKPLTAVEMRAAVSEQVRDAVDRGIIPGLSSEPGGMLPPPPGYDKLAGRTCSAPGKPKRFGGKGVCGRQASAVLRSVRFDVPRDETIDSQDASLRRGLTLMAYGLDGGRMPYAGGGPRVGKQVPDHNGPPHDGDTFVCAFHSYAANQGVPHPEDVPPEPKVVTPPPSVGSLADLDHSRQWRVVGSDPNFVNLTDGRTSVLVRTSEYLAFLRDNGSLPRPGQPL